MEATVQGNPLLLILKIIFLKCLVLILIVVRLRTEIGLWWLAQNSHTHHVDSQLERTTPDCLDNQRVELNPSSQNGVFLMETKNKASFLDRLCRHFHFSHKSYVDPIGVSGGLALWWTDDIHLDVRFSLWNMIRSVISSFDSQSSWAATFVYAPPQRLLRKNLWNQFRQMANENSYPWLYIGDLNEIGCMEEQSGEAECRISQL
ncbi:hypothetical protein LOK49_LG13G02958 [Camellia lanceoleosa]|uniref:Uncharacterized protein n=1 Tax=Camellia lanceoleosa TaxID=1840588 RepID=A0ACC0FIE7_9ERIC|nr:hypothetical protein LOK49_LG13G02958 [Camellia lanceoleosa]